MPFPIRRSGTGTPGQRGRRPVFAMFPIKLDTNMLTPDEWRSTCRGTLELLCPPPTGTSMASRETAFVEITPEVLLKAYACGIFPMAESAEDPALYWIEPPKRGIIPLDTFHVSIAACPHRPRRIASALRSTATSRACWTAAPSRSPAARAPGSTRASARSIEKLYDIGHCHSIEAYENGETGRRALWRLPRPRVLRREHVPSRARRLEGGAGASGGAAAGRRLRAARHAVRHGSSEDVRRGRSVASRSITSCSKQRLVGEADFAALAGT